MHHFQQLVDHINSSIEAKIKEIIQPIEKEILDTKVNINSISDTHKKFLHKINLQILNSEKSEYEDWKHTIWASLFLKSYAEFESNFELLCNEVRNIKAIALSISDLNDHGIVRAKKYLELVADIRLTVPMENWNDLKNINRLRNILVHNSGILKRNDVGQLKDKDLEKYIEKEPDLGINEKDKIIISVNYLITTHRLFYNIILHLTEDVNDILSTQ